MGYGDIYEDDSERYDFEHAIGRYEAAEPGPEDDDAEAFEFFGSAHDAGVF